MQNVFIEFSIHFNKINLLMLFCNIKLFKVLDYFLLMMQYLNNIEFI